MASRVLPFKFMSLVRKTENSWKRQLVGYLRGIEFIYKEPGVNRPLKPVRQPENDQNKTYYRNQINKVANAISEIIEGTKNPSSSEKAVKKVVQPENKQSKWYKKRHILYGAVLLVLLIVASLLFIPRLNKSTENLEKSIAVLPFINESPNDSASSFIDGVMDEILSSLQKIKNFSIGQIKGLC